MRTLLFWTYTNLMNVLKMKMNFLTDCLLLCILYKKMHLPVFFIVVDWNADVSDNHCIFAKHLMQFCHNNGLIRSSKVLFPNSSYTYVSNAWHTTSWLDHCFCTENDHDSIQGIRVNYKFATTDHMPFFLCVNVNCIPSLLPIYIGYITSIGKKG